MGWSKLSISLKTTLISCTIVLGLLVLVTGFIINKQSSLVQSILDQYQGMIQQTFKDQASRDSSSLEERIQVNTKICSGLSGVFLYNYDTDGLKKNLSSMLALPDILAIRITDAENKPFVALWKEGESVKDGEVLGDGASIAEDKMFSDAIILNDEVVGKVELFYSDNLLVVQMQEVKQKLKNDVAVLSSGIDDKIQAAKYSQLIAIVFVIISLVITTMTTLKFVVVARLRHVTASLQDIAEGEGDLTKRLVDKYDDEIGELCSWFNIFIEKIHDIIKEVSRGSQDLDGASDQLASLSDDMKQDASQTSVKAGNVSRSSEGMSDNMTSVAAAMEQAATNINMVASAAEEMNVTIGQISENTEQARGVAVNAVTQTEDASKQVDELGKAAEAIGKVLETISEISEQVNLLALNATIEAARAGDAGKGFAVVANEIKDLAKQTASATGEIREKIENIQSSTQDTVTGIEQIAGVVEEVNVIVTTIATSIEEQSAATREIASNVAQASDGIMEVNENVAQSNVSVGAISDEIGEVTEASNKISENSNMVNSSAEKLSHLSKQLHLMVGRFKL